MELPHVFLLQMDHNYFATNAFSETIQQDHRLSFILYKATRLL